MKRIILLFFWLGCAGAQTPPAMLPVHSPAVDASGETSRLRQMESIYQQQLRSRHVPLLGAYVTTLQKLAAASADPLPYQKEIERVQAIIGGGGVVDLNTAIQSLRAPSEMPIPEPLPPPKRQEKVMITLTPALSRRISPLPAGSASPRSAAIGEIEWRIDALPAGTYDVVLQYSLPTPDEAVRGEVTFAEHKLDFALAAGQGMPKSSFRLLRLGQFKVEQETRGQILSLRAGAPESRSLLVREILVSRTKEDR
jgi:hypothetical protein